ncbi:hypothetical protein SAMN05192566_0750 [Methylophilus rhizosphaerae]|uniref:Uncharacterized protein n=1 Tax=Methylophilus rhizosphaerae TaxID=492660 RepID=A0A1G9AAS6_9PROT|nr:hypothetical protein [Methylophilus rhizosphaerae]SDK23705.1 hypothetical protein SAMN05192566_0750 [Methylophilus rhizosphaerae]
MNTITLKISVLILSSLMSITAFSKESVSTNINVSATVYYQCQIPSNNPKVNEICAKQMPPKVETDGKYLIHTY